jgi:hypothetical protein
LRLGRWVLRVKSIVPRCPAVPSEQAANSHWVGFALAAASKHLGELFLRARAAHDATAVRHHLKIGLGVEGRALDHHRHDGRVEGLASNL